MTSPNAAATESGRRTASGTPASPPPPATDPNPHSILSASTNANANAPIPESQPQPPQPKPEPEPNHQVAPAISHDRIDIDEDYPMPSPPTVSPLSTPAATNINIDETTADDDIPNMHTELPPPTNGLPQPHTMAGPNPDAMGSLAEAFSMELDQAHVPDQLNRMRDQVQAVATTDPDPNSMDYSPHNIVSNLRNPQGSIDPNAYMMSIAQATSALFHTPGPAVVAPSEVSLQASFTQESEAVTGSGEPTSASASQKLESFARVEFADSVFQMTTYAVIIGRDQRAMDQARRDEKREQSYRRRAEENARNGLPPPTPLNFDRGKFSKSYVSEEGGMLGPESDGEDNVAPVRKRRANSVKQSVNGDADDDAQSDRVKSNRQYVSHTPGAAAVDLGTLQPSPSHIPFVGIHSPGPDIASKTRGISRQHLKIEFNEKRGVFEGIAMHKNGFFCDDAHYGLDDPVTLRSGDRLQIKDVEFTFVINGVQTGKTGGEEYHDEEETSSKRMSIGGKEMSFDFEHSDHENFQDTSESLSEIENAPTPPIGVDEGEENHEAEAAAEAEVATEAAAVAEAAAQAKADAEVEAELMDIQSDAEGEQDLDLVESTEIQGEIPPEFLTPEIPRRRGPGRPPKDGIMSKRERRLLKKQMLETSRKTIPQDPQDPQGEKIKRPVGRPRKNPLPEDGETPEKRKYNKRKSKEEGEEGSDAERRAREKKDKKVRPKSPPLELRKEDFTEEQLQKPSKNYGVLIDEALTNGPPDGLTLKQIYKRIMAKYPWFYFFSETKGWESSVRHNLIGNEAFKKAEATGLWSRVPGVELDAGKKRKANSPDRLIGPPHPHSQHQQYYQNGHYLPPSNMNFAHGVPNYAADNKHAPAGYQPPSGPAALSHSPAPSQPVAQSMYPAQASAPAQLPPGYGASALLKQPNPGQQSTYSSPYARPPPPSGPTVKPENPAPSNPQAVSAAPIRQAAAQSIPQQQQQQQQQHQPAAANTANATFQPPLSPEIETAIATFRTNMMNVISSQTSHAAQIIDAAINRARGLPVHNSVPGFESVETTLIKAVQKMINEMQKHRKTTSASPAPAAPTAPAANPATSAPAKSGPTPSPAPTSTVEAEIQRRIKGFRDSMIGALRKKTDQAETIVDSAINRAQGLPNTGKVQGWEEADDLMVKSVTGIIAEARKAHNLSAQQSPPAPAPATATSRPSQPTQAAPRHAPSASPAPVPPTTGPAHPSNGATTNPSTTALAHSVSSTAKPAAPSISRPGVSFQRPTSMGIARPGVSSLSRPSVVRKDSGPTTVAPPVTAPPPPVHNVSSPAPPSAGVVDQITGMKRALDDGHSNNNGNGSGSGSGNGNGNGNGNGGLEPAKPVPPKAPTPVHNVSSPAPPSAGVVDQIAGQKRPLDEGPSNGTSEQPEPKKMAISPA